MLSAPSDRQSDTMHPGFAEVVQAVADPVAERTDRSSDDEHQRTSFDRWGHRKSRDIKEAAQLLLNDPDPEQPKRLLLNLSVDEGEQIKVESFDVVTTKELIDTIGKSAAIIEKNFQSSTARRLADRTLVPVYTVCDGVLRIIPKLLNNPPSSLASEPNTSQDERAVSSKADLKEIRQMISKIVDDMNGSSRPARLPDKLRAMLFRLSRRQLGKITILFAIGIVMLLYMILATKGYVSMWR